MIAQKLDDLRLPELLSFDNGTPVDSESKLRKRQDEIKTLLQNEIYGTIPDKTAVSNELISRDEKAYANKAVQSMYKLSFPELNGFSFPVCTVFPKAVKSPPLFVFINFRDNIPDKYYPTEEIIDNGFAVASFCYKDVTSDDDDFTNGLAGALNIDRTVENAAGKIALWAWTASETLDFLETIGGYDQNNVAVMGHSRLGKTALVAGAFDERFRFVFSNDSGCSGAAITRQKTGEHVDEICNRFSQWFCPNYNKYRNNESIMPFEQHFLLSLSAPRHIVVSSAVEDVWADPNSEYLCCAAVSPAYELFGKKGFQHPDRLPKPGDEFFDGSVGYQLRSGCHYLSRCDWQKYMEFIRLKADT